MACERAPTYVGWNVCANIFIQIWSYTEERVLLGKSNISYVTVAYTTSHHYFHFKPQLHQV